MFHAALFSNSLLFRRGLIGMGSGPLIMLTNHF